MTLEESCRYAARMYERWDTAHARALAGRWNLAWKQQIGRMSGGDERKAALVLALASRPEVLLLDEPAAGLDPIARRGVIDEIIETVARGEGCTVLISTHLLEDLERLVDHVGFMESGRLIISSRLDDLQSTTKRVQLVFNGERAPENFFVPGAVWKETAGPVLTALVRLANEAQLDALRYLPDARLQVFPLSLEDIFIAFFGKGRSASRAVPLGSARVDSFSGDQLSDEC
jgi:ABC-2 type transport system ATP-binding protein